MSALLEEANVARRSLYEHFGGKDGLVAAVLRRTADKDLAWYESALGDGDSPRGRLLALFDRLDELVSNAGFRGCRYLATDLAFADQDHPAHAETDAYRRRIRALLVRELEALGHARPEHAAEQLHLLIEGTLVMGATQNHQHPARVARDLAASTILAADWPLDQSSLLPAQEIQGGDGVQPHRVRLTQVGCVNAPHLVALVRTGARFERGALVERPDESGDDQRVA